ncbi:MAG TPA: ECF transporter S component [Clostridiales bacterium]|nr:ECF transporter S component [Clostridiales bacterium]
MSQTEKTNRLAKMALMAAIAAALLFIQIPFPPAPFLKYDPADIPILISGFAFGPLAGVAITFVVSFIQAFFMGGDGIYGFTMHMLATSSFVIVAGLIYKHNKTRKTAVIALLVGSLLMTAVMVAANLIVTPLYMGVPREVVMGMLLTVIIPFNLLKAVINSVVTFLIYKPLSRFLHR